MSKATLNDVRVFLEHLLKGSPRAELDGISAAAGYAAVTERTLASIEALPPALLGGAPNAEELETADTRHDGLGDALLYLGKAILAHPGTTAEQKAAARFIHRAIVPSRGSLRASYASEAAQAAERRPKVDAEKDTLKRLTVVGSDAYAWATAFLDAGATLATLLAARADALGDRSPAGALRSKAIGQIGTLRQIVADALETEPAAARKADADLFGFYDVLAGMRERGSTEPTPPPPDAPPST